MKCFKILSFPIVITAILTSCDGLKMSKNIFETSERAKYERRFSGADSIMTHWKNNFSSATNNQLTVKDRFVAVVAVNHSDIPALGYSLELKKGDLLIVETVKDNLQSRIFVDITDVSTSDRKSQSEVITNQKITKFVENSGWHKVVVQPEIEYEGTFQLKIYTQPSLAFPVAGKGNRDVQSFWGASRDGGGRSHEGIDIFASKGTPVVAIADGVITRTGNQGLGGKQVWLRDSNLGNSYYYAHLDSILTQSGKRVSIGDTLGWVGNTGNAAGGSPHLHFGIYTAGGAVDPYPYVRKRAVPNTSAVSAATIISEKNIRSGSNLRTGPGTQYSVLTNISIKTKCKILSVNGLWYHVKTNDGVEGFIISDRLE